MNLSAPSLSVVSRLGETIAYLAHIRGDTFSYVSEVSDDVRESIDRSDYLILNKHLSINGIELCKYAKKRNKIIVYDIDDWILGYPEYSNGAKSPDMLINERKLIKEYLQLSDLVTVANPYLQKLTSQLDVSCSLVPNGIWVEKYSVNVGEKVHSDECLSNEKLKVLLVNADKLKMRNAELFYDALNSFLTKNKNVEFYYIGDHPEDFEFIPCMESRRRLPYEIFMKHICESDFDFALVPLADSKDKENEDFNRSKSPFKYFNFGCARIPAIYSSETIYDEVVDNGKSGMLVKNTTQAWEQAMGIMASNSKLRAQVANVSHNDVLNNYHIANASNKLHNLLG